MYYFASVYAAAGEGKHQVVDPQTGRPIVEIAPQPNAPPLPVSPHATPESFVNYGVQGLIVTIIISLGKPLIDRITLLISEKAKLRKDKEDRVQDAQLKQADLMQKSVSDQQEFLQQMVCDQQKRSDELLAAQHLAHSERIQVMMDILKANLATMEKTHELQVAELQTTVQGLKAKLEQPLDVRVISLVTESPLEVSMEEPVDIRITEIVNGHYLPEATA